MADFTEDDLAREMEENKQQRDAEKGQAGESGAATGDGPKRRGPPRRKAGSSALNCVPNEMAAE